MIPVFIVARLGSIRLPEKALKYLGEKRVIEHVIARCTHFGMKPFLCCPLLDADEFSGCVYNVDFTLFGGDPDNVEARVIDCALHHDIKVFHALDGDDPFFDEQEVMQSYGWAQQQRFSRVYPNPHSRAGAGRVGTTYNLQGQPGSLGYLVDSGNEPWPQRLTLDYEEDYHLICAVNRMVGGYMAPRSVVDDLFRRNPDLHRINWFRNAEWKTRQENQSCAT